MLTIAGLIFSILAVVGWFLPLNSFTFSTSGMIGDQFSGMHEVIVKSHPLLDGMLGTNIYKTNATMLLDGELTVAFILHVLLILLVLAFLVLNKTELNYRVFLPIFEIPCAILSLTSLCLTANSFSSTSHGLGTLIFIICLGLAFISFTLDAIKWLYQTFDHSDDDNGYSKEKY